MDFSLSLGHGCLRSIMFSEQREMAKASHCSDPFLGDPRTPRYLGLQGAEQETFSSGRKILMTGESQPMAHICQNTLNCWFRRVNYIVCKLCLNKAIEKYPYSNL